MTKKSTFQLPWYAVLVATKSNVVKAISKLVPPKEVEDIVQETYVRVCQLDNPETMDKPGSLLMTTAKNIAFDYLKRSETRLADSAIDESDFAPELRASDQVFEATAKQQEFAQLCEAVRHLPTQCRRVFVLKKVYGYSQKEIAQELQISQSTVEKHVALGLKKCAEYLLKFESNGVSDAQTKATGSSVSSIRGFTE
jgi:RNA polymerase sigma-70 factor (ECF subfamily)